MLQIISLPYEEIYKAKSQDMDNITVQVERTNASRPSLQESRERIHTPPTASTYIWMIMSSQRRDVDQLD